MISPTRTLLVLAGVAVLAASSQATITFSGYSSQFNFEPAVSNVLEDTPPSFHLPVIGAGPVTNTGSFQVSDSSGLSELDVTEADGYVIDGTLTLDVTVTGPGITGTDTLYDKTISSAVLGPLGYVALPASQDNFFSPSLVGTYTVSYTATYSGSSVYSMGYLGRFAVAAYPTPEPAAYATLGVGVIGLLVRRRRSAK